MRTTWEQLHSFSEAPANELKVMLTPFSSVDINFRVSRNPGVSKIVITDSWAGQPNSGAA